MPPGSFDTPDRFADANEIVDAAREFIASHRLIHRQDFVLAAVSGGADSMALLSILHRLSRDVGFALAACHFNHQLRPSSGRDLDAVGNFAASLGLSFHSGAEDVRSIAQATGDTLEEAARKARYRFLHRIADETRADRIATGHTRDDQVETVLMRILHGTGMRGLAGIPVRRGKVIRPLLGLQHGETVSYCRASGIPVAEDSTNEDLRFHRNRIRNELLPLLESQYHPGVRDNLVRLAENAQTILETIRSATAPLLEKNLAQDSPGRWTLATTDLDRLDDTAIVVLFGDLFADALACDMDFTRAHYDGLVRLVRDPRAMGKSISLPGLHVRKEHNGLVISRLKPQGSEPLGPACGDSEPFPAHAETVLALPGETATGALVITTDVFDRAAQIESGFAATETEAYFDRTGISPPLTLRAALPGDRMQPFGMAGTKKLSDIFIDKKIPASSRTTSLVITDTRDILWLVGITTSEKCRVGAGTREVVRIRIRRT